ncbi:hypothetical protein MTBBW1_190001 [Desulfamplus magnetovallimortis]|uniref:Uncharacterized protein n=1 Tax=Desulfamplus magnetovallimortis TaxID=1246637 RepID=A0A1W1HB12_9BACT|nr:hypothetical protein MTBBW1_190001 [Desulfamplus magnetovallimortis]
MEEAGEVRFHGKFHIITAMVDYHYDPRSKKYHKHNILRGNS